MSRILGNRETGSPVPVRLSNRTTGSDRQPGEPRQRGRTLRKELLQHEERTDRKIQPSQRFPYRLLWLRSWSRLTWPAKAAV